MKDNTIGILYALLAYFMFISGDVFYKLAGQTYNVIHIAFYAKLAALIVFVGYVLIKKYSFKTKYPKWQLIRSIAITYNFFCLVYCYKYITLVDMSFLFYLSPFFIAVLSLIILKEPIGIHRIVSIIGGFIGILLVLRPGMIEISPAVLFMLSSIIIFCYANILSRKIGPEEPSINFTLYPTFLTVLCVVPFVLVNPVVPPVKDLGIMVSGGILGSIAIMIIAMAYVKTHAVTVSMLGYSDIIWALTFGYFIFGDVTNDIFSIIGGTTIIVSGVYLIYRESKAKPKIA